MKKILTLICIVMMFTAIALLGSCTGNGNKKDSTTTPVDSTSVPGDSTSESESEPEEVMVPYVVKHYKKDLNGTVTLMDTEELEGYEGEVTATPNTYDGYVYAPNISEDVVELVEGEENVLTLYYAPEGVEYHALSEIEPSIKIGDATWEAAEMTEVPDEDKREGTYYLDCVESSAAVNFRCTYEEKNVGGYVAFDLYYTTFAGSAFQMWTSTNATDNATLIGVFNANGEKVAPEANVWLTYVIYLDESAFPTNGGTGGMNAGAYKYDLGWDFYTVNCFYMSNYYYLTEETLGEHFVLPSEPVIEISNLTNEGLFFAAFGTGLAYGWPDAGLWSLFSEAGNEGYAVVDTTGIRLTEKHTVFEFVLAVGWREADDAFEDMSYIVNGKEYHVDLATATFKADGGTAEISLYTEAGKKIESIDPTAATYVGKRLRVIITGIEAGSDIKIGIHSGENGNFYQIKSMHYITEDAFKDYLPAAKVEIGNLTNEGLFFATFGTGLSYGWPDAGLWSLFSEAGNEGYAVVDTTGANVTEWHTVFEFVLAVGWREADDAFEDMSYIVNGKEYHIDLATATFKADGGTAEISLYTEDGEKIESIDPTAATYAGKWLKVVITGIEAGSDIKIGIHSGENDNFYQIKSMSYLLG